MVTNRTFITKIVLVGICIFIVPSFLFAKDRITWMKYDWPPVYISKGLYKGQGNADAILKFFQEQLYEYDHITIQVNPARAIKLMKDGEKVCMVGTLKTPERERFLYYAIPIGITLPNAIIVKKNRLSSFKNVENISLEKLLKNKKLRGGIIKKRSYTPVIDQILNKYTGQPNLYVQSSSRMAENLLKMLLADRIDYIIEYPWVTVFLEKILGKKEITTSIAIEETKPFSFGMVACPKNRWGSKVIKRINQILLKSRPTPEYREFVERWNSKKDLIRIRKGYNEIFLKMNK